MCCSHCGGECRHAHDGSHACSCHAKNHDAPRARGEAAPTVAEALRMPRPWVLASLSRTCGISELEVARELPQEMSVVVDGSCFEQVWRGICEWEKATFMMNHFGHLIEMKCRLRPGKSSRGYYHLDGGDGLSGHIKADDIAAVCYLSLPFMGRTVHSIQFFNAEGRVVFSVFPGRGEQGVIPSVLEAYQSMRRSAMEAAA